MKLVKKINSNALSGNYVIYELTEDEIYLSNAPAKYMLSQEISDYAMKNMNVVDLIQANIRGSEYTFGIAFCDTIKEAVLSYKCAALEKQMRNLKYLFKDVTDTFDNYEEKIRYIYIV